MLSRREFHRAAVGVAAGIGCSIAAKVSHAEPEKVYPKGKFFDIHTHLGQTWNTTQILTPEELLRWMDAHDVAQAAVLPLASPESSSFLLTPDFVLAQTQPFRDRLIPFCSIDPRTSYSGGKKGLVAILQRWIDAGAKGFGEHKTGVPIDDKRNMAVYEACAEVKLPVLFHMDNQRNMDQPGLPGLAKALAEFPTVNFIGHGPGWWASISAGTKQADLEGYPKSAVAAGGAIDTLMDKYPNIFGDMSAGSGAGAIKRDLKFGREFVVRRADRLLFGTDFLSPGQAVPQFELVETLDLPEEVQRKVFRDNARRLLSL